MPPGFASVHPQYSSSGGDTSPASWGGGVDRVNQTQKMLPGSAAEPNAAAKPAPRTAAAKPEATKPTAKPARCPVLCCGSALLLLALRPTAVIGFAVTPRVSLPGILYGRCAAATTGERSGGVSSLYFMGRGGAAAAATAEGEGEDRRGSGMVGGGGVLPGQQPPRRNVVSSHTESGLALGYPFPYASPSRANFRRDAMKFLR